MSGDKSSGIATALAELLGQPQATEDGQPELFDPADFGDDLPGPTSAVAKSGPKGGRPKGARNKSTEQIRQYIAAHYKHPLIGLAEMWSRTPTQLAVEMDLWEYRTETLGGGMGSRTERFLATGEAARLQQAAMIAALPYLAQKMPIQIEQKVKQLGVLLLGDMRRDGGRMIDGLGLPADDGDVVDIPMARSPLGGDGS